jgi:hypothetical protein
MGSLVGAFTSFVTTYANQRAQYRRDFLSRQFAQRETLYSEFINEAARLQVDSLDHQMEQPSTLVAIYALANRIRLNASDEVVQAATKTIQTIVESYRRPKMTAEQIRQGAYLEIPDPVKEFGQSLPQRIEPPPLRPPSPLRPTITIIRANPCPSRLPCLFFVLFAPFRGYSVFTFA